MTHRIRFVFAASLLSLAPLAAGSEPEPLVGYVLVGVGTTAMYVPNDGEVSGPQRDVSPTIGVGWFATETVSLELDAYMTFTPEGYLATGGGPAVAWAFDPHAFAAIRLFVPFDPTLDLVVLPGVGLTHAFANGLAPFVELDVASAIGRGHPDLAVLPSAGLSYLF